MHDENPELGKILKREKIIIFLHGVYKSKEMKDIVFGKIHLLNLATECYRLDPLFYKIVKMYYNLFEE